METWAITHDIFEKSYQKPFSLSKSSTSIYSPACGLEILSHDGFTGTDCGKAIKLQYHNHTSSTITLRVSDSRHSSFKVQKRNDWDVPKSPHLFILSNSERSICTRWIQTVYSKERKERWIFLPTLSPQIISKRQRSNFHWPWSKIYEHITNDKYCVQQRKVEWFLMKIKSTGNSRNDHIPYSFIFSLKAGEGPISALRHTTWIHRDPHVNVLSQEIMSRRNCRWAFEKNASPNTSFFSKIKWTWHVGNRPEKPPRPQLSCAIILAEL